MKEKFVSYLENLKFDPNLRHTFHGRYMVNIRLVILIIIGILVLGTYSFFQIPRRLNPELKIPIINVSTVIPGASPNDVESLVTIPLEDKLSGVKGLSTITSSSLESVSAITMEFNSGVDPEKARSDVQSIVDTVNDLPTDADTPRVAAIDFEDVPVWTFAVTGKSDTASLMRFSRALQDHLDDLPKVDRVITSGFEEQEVQVVLNPVKLREYNLNPVVLSGLVAKETNSYPAGNVNTIQYTFPLTIDRSITNIEDIRNIHINTQNQVIKLGDIADVFERSKSDQTTTLYTTPKTSAHRAVQFFVYKTSSTSINEAEEEIKKEVESVTRAYHGEFKIVTIVNTGEEIEKQFNDLLGEFTSTIILVFINLFLFLGLRQAVISSFTVPLTFLSAFTILNILGMSLNFLTLFAFLLALGLLIDDTIVTVAAMTRYYGTGKFKPDETGMLVWRDFIVPLWSTTITTIWAFVPLLIATGIIGEFIKPIPIVVTATLVSSTAIAVLITLPLMIVALKPNAPKRVVVLLKVLISLALIGMVIAFLPKNIVLAPVIIVLLIFMIVTYHLRHRLTREAHARISISPFLTQVSSKLHHTVNHGVINTEKLSNSYMNIIDRIISSKSNRRKVLFVLIVFAIVAYLLVPLGLVKTEFFPKTNQNVIYIQVELPPGTNLGTTTVEMNAMLKTVRNTPYADFILGESGTTNATGFSGRSSNANTFLITVHLIDKEERETSSIDIAEGLRKQLSSYTKGTVSVQEESGGPPAGADLQIKLSGDDLGSLNEYADQIVNHLKKQQGVTNVSKSISASTSKLSFVPDKTSLANAALTPDVVGLYLRTYATGFPLETIKIENTDTDIVLKMNDENRTPQELSSLVIQSPTGQSYPLDSLGELKMQANPTVITRENGKRTLSVTATVTKGYVVADKNKELETFAATLELPPGYTWKTGGVNEENQKSVNSILQAMGLSFLLIMATMIIEFRSYRQAIMILLLIPLAIPGVFYVFALTGTPLSFPALIGILALFGLVVTNGIVVIEKINDNRHAGMNVHDAIVDASGSRLEPILLTSITSILGLIPITIADPLWRGLGGAIISGLLFSGAIKLFFIPIMYYNWYKDEDKISK